MSSKVKKVMTQPISVIFRMLQGKQRLQIWLYEQTNVRYVPMSISLLFSLSGIHLPFSLTDKTNRWDRQPGRQTHVYRLHIPSLTHICMLSTLTYVYTPYFNTLPTPSIHRHNTIPHIQTFPSSLSIHPHTHHLKTFVPSFLYISTLHIQIRRQAHWIWRVYERGLGWCRRSGPQERHDKRTRAHSLERGQYNIDHACTERIGTWKNKASMACMHAKKSLHSCKWDQIAKKRKRERRREKEEIEKKKKQQKEN